MTYEEKCARLYELIDVYTREDVLLAFSGGADSSLLLKLLCKSAAAKQKKVYAVTFHTMLHTTVETEEAERLAQEAGATFFLLETDALQSAGISDNPVDRCYRCKKYLFTRILEKAKELGVNTVLEGTNEDDLHVYRPGRRAVQELGIQSPLALCGMTKQEVRRCCREQQVAVFRKPAAPCLATRFPYGTCLTAKKMRQVEKGEAYLRSLGLYNVRLRVHEKVARIEVDEKDMPVLMAHRKEAAAFLKKLGYSYVTLDLEGFRSGSMDEGITAGAQGSG